MWANAKRQTAPCRRSFGETSAFDPGVAFKSRTTTEQLRLGATLACGLTKKCLCVARRPRLFLVIIQLSVEQHLSSCLCVADLFLVLKATEERTC